MFQLNCSESEAKVNCNWKSGAENFTGDSSHTPMTHRSILGLKIINPAVDTTMSEVGLQDPQPTVEGATR